MSALEVHWIVAEEPTSPDGFLQPSAPSTSSGGGLPATIRALKHRNFQLFFSGQMISLVGTWMQSIGEAWLVYRLTGSSLLLGVVGFASQIPVFLVAPLGGIVADRYNRQRVVIATQTASMILAADSGRAHVERQGSRLACDGAGGTCLGVVNAFDIPARQAFLVDMVGKEDLMNAIALNSSMFNGARIIGPAIAGILVAKIGEGWCFFSNSVSYIAVIAGLLMMRVNQPSRLAYFSFAPGSHHRRLSFRPAHRSDSGVVAVAWTGEPGGHALHRAHADVSPTKFCTAAHAGLGILMGATGVGALAGALTLASRTGVRGLGRWVAFSCAGFGISLVLFSLSRTFWLSAALLLPVGFCMMLQMSSSNTLIQAMVPDHLRGRVMALYSMMFMGMAPFGALIGGALADRIGAPVTVGAGAVAGVFGAAWFGFRLPKIRVEARRLIVAQAMAGGEPAAEMTARVVED